MIIATTYEGMKNTVVTRLKSIITDCQAADIGVFAVEKHELREEVEFWLSEMESTIKAIREELENYYDGEEV